MTWIFVLLSSFYLGLLPTSIFGQQQQENTQAVDLKIFCPTSGNQEEVGACVGFAVGYGAMSILQAIQYQWTNTDTINKNAFSASFIYNQLHRNDENCQDAIRVEDALQLIKERGNCLEQDFQFTTDCSIQPDAPQLDNALVHTIKDYKKIFDSKKRDTSIEPSARIELIKQYLRDSIPVIVDFQVYRCFRDRPKGVHLWSKHSTDYEGLHTMVVVGFDEIKNTFEVMNSWGNQWANKGFIKIRFKEFIKYSSGGYVIVPHGFINKSNN